MDKRKILIVDYEPYVRRLIKRALDNGYIVLEASDGEEAINITRTEKPDLILMDILMPNLDGYTACYEIKKEQATRAIPVIILTGIGYELNKRLSQEMGADGYRTKPFNLQDLRDKIKQYQLSKCKEATEQIQTNNAPNTYESSSRILTLVES